jgi:site-specific DNA-methyltransferase (adenine-specific)
MTTDYLAAARQPDIVEVIANLSNDAVFTPPRVVNAVLDLLPTGVWADPTLRWLDPASKTGVFPREITKRLMAGLVPAIPDETERLHHILTEMVWAIATEEITALMSRRSLYCSKDASGEFSAFRFETPEGHVWHQRVEHSFDVAGQCSECKGSRQQLEVAGRDNKAYGFIHMSGRTEIEKGMNMKFDVIVGNPPYQMDAEGGNRTMPLYNIFVEEAKKLNPRYISMIIPSRWMASGLGLGEFRGRMLADRHIRKLVSYAKMETLFPGVDFEGGVCYFLWDRDNEGACSVTYIQDDVTVGPVERDLNEFDIFVRDSRALPVLEKVLAKKETPLIEMLAADKEFGMTSNFTGFSTRQREGMIPLYYNSRGRRMTGWMRRADVPKSRQLIDTWKVLIPEAYGERGAIPAQILGPTRIVPPPSACTQTNLFVHTDSRSRADSIESYVHTRFVRFLISLRKTTQHATRSTYTWVPQQSWDRDWIDAELYERYGITAEEQAHIEAMIRPWPG